MKRLVVVIAILMPLLAHGEIYKCVKDGKTLFQAAPCDPESQATTILAVRKDKTGEIPWAGVKYGMSVEEVSRKVAGTKPVKGNGNHLVNGAKVRLVKEDANIGGVPLVANFFFQDDGFTQVNLSDPVMPSPNSESRRKYQQLVAEYRAKYGEEVRNEVNEKSWGISAKAEWQVGNDRIWINITPVTRDTSFFTTGFKPGK